MTNPTLPVAQTNAKAWAALLSTLVGAAVPIIGQVAGVLPAPYGAILSGILGVFSLFTGTVVHQVSNAPKGTVLVPTPIALPPSTKGPWQ